MANNTENSVPAGDSSHESSQGGHIGVMDTSSLLPASELPAHENGSVSSHPIDECVRMSNQSAIAAPASASANENSQGLTASSMPPASAPPASVDLLSRLVLPKPKIFSHSRNAENWRNAWTIVLHELPIMFRNNETYIYHHIATGGIMSGTERQLGSDFTKFLDDGWKMEREKTYHAHLPHPKLKKMCLRVEITPILFTHDEKELPLCPLMLGLGSMSDSMTYLRVSFSSVKVPKELVKASLDLVNGKF